MARGRMAAGKRTGCVYLICDEARSKGKIGRSHDPVRRRAEVQTGCSERVLLIATWKMRAAASVTIEVALHQLFRPLRRSGEWFQVGLHEVRPVINLLIADDPESAATLASAIVEAREAWASYAAAEGRLLGCSKRWWPEKHAELHLEEREAYGRLRLAQEAAKALGMEDRMASYREPALA